MRIAALKNSNCLRALARFFRILASSLHGQPKCSSKIEIYFVQIGVWQKGHGVSITILIRDVV